MTAPFPLVPDLDSVIEQAHPTLTPERVAAVIASIHRAHYAPHSRGRCDAVLFHAEDVSIRCPNPALPSTWLCLGHSLAAFDAGTLQIGGGEK